MPIFRHRSNQWLWDDCILHLEKRRQVLWKCSLWTDWWGNLQHAGNTNWWDTGALLSKMYIRYNLLSTNRWTWGRRSGGPYRFFRKIQKQAPKWDKIRVLWLRSIHSFHNGGLYKGRRKCCCKNYALVTPENDHSCNINFGLNNFMISHICLDYDIHTIKCWSDSCALQFCSQYAFYMLTRFDPAINVHWNYFEANHGKGAVDGIGGTVNMLYSPMS